VRIVVVRDGLPDITAKVEWWSSWSAHGIIITMQDIHDPFHVDG
jgi:hypothetical protein